MIEKMLSSLHYDFVQHALAAGTVAAILGAVVGYFVMIRNVGFAAHALSHIGFAGAAGAALLGLTPLEGMLWLTVCSGVIMGASADRVQRSEMAIGMVLSASLGLGSLFLSLSSGSAAQAKAILLGDILGISSHQIVEMILLAVGALLALAVFARKLLFASVQPALAEARGLSLTALSMSFMAILALSVTLASQVVGILPVFTLILAPAGIMQRWTRTFWAGIFGSIFLAVGVVWAGILLACLNNWPVTFWITTLFFVLYLLSELYARLLLQSDR